MSHLKTFDGWLKYQQLDGQPMPEAALAVIAP
jgi:hypothetical protein